MKTRLYATGPTDDRPFVHVRAALRRWLSPDARPAGGDREPIFEFELADLPPPGRRMARCGGRTGL